jgi:SAM-dependent methyltransferase
MMRSSEKEMMDLPGNPREVLEEDLKNLRILNQYLGGYRCAERGIAWIVQQEKLTQFSLLDVGTGSADVAARIVHWSRSKGVAVRIVALDLDPVTAAVAARRANNLPEISVIRGDAAAPPFAAASFDFVLASQFLHHFSEEKIVALLKTWAQLARRAIIVSDLVRHPLAYYGARALTRLFTKNIMTLTDAPLSVKRALTSAEWRELFRRAAIGQFDLVSVFPFRIMAQLDVQH